ncbi:MAG TPA: ABC transporter ATP-binding protein [Thioalkalivibrio sp.]|nr:ABC transporter ATP-binding protein [Thioalkalivibrio sp.]
MHTTDATPLIRARGLSRTYDQGGIAQHVLRDADLDVAAGEQVALIGRSGSGKSTLLNLLAGIDRPDAGSILIGDVALHALDETARTRFRRTHIGFVYQFFNLIPTLTAVENAALPLELTGTPRRRALRRAREDLATLGLAARADAIPDQLSGGERQRVAVARALIHAPTLVLADEPTGNLDVAIGRQVLAQLQGLCRERGTTLVTVTHSGEVAAGADRVLTLEAGRLRETGEVQTW